MWENIRWQHKNNNLKTMAPTLDDEFEFKLDESYFVLHITSSYLYLRQQDSQVLVFKIKDGYKLELQTPKTTKTW